MKTDGVILVISHDVRLADVRKRRLQEAGYDVVSAMDVQSIRVACATRHIRLAVIGYSLPPAEKRRATLEIVEACGRKTPILQLEAGQNIAAVVVETTALDHRADRADPLVENIRQLLA